MQVQRGMIFLSQQLVHKEGLIKSEAGAERINFNNWCRKEDVLYAGAGAERKDLCRQELVQRGSIYVDRSWCREEGFM
jgi:hypothetical protein